jgi:uncharacterized Fe-S cluster protein YjdI
MARTGALVGAVLAAVILGLPGAALAAPAPSPVGHGGQARASLRWGSPDLVDNWQSTPEAVSCPTATFCVAVDQEGNAVPYDGHNWGTPVSIDPPRIYKVDGSLEPDPGRLVAVSCASATFCVAIDSYFALTYNGKTWSKPRLINVAGAQQDAMGGSLSSVSCPSVGFCAAEDGSDVYFLHGKTWTEQKGVDPFATSISCSSSSFCVVVDGNDESTGGTRTFSDGTWSARTANATSGPVTISCVSPTFCVGANQGHTFTFDGTSWTDDSDFGSEGPTAVSCLSASWCQGVNYTGDAFHFDGTSWTGGQLVDPSPPPDGGAGLVALSCASTTSCQAVDQFGNAVAFADGSWATPTVMEAVTGYFQSVSCPSAGFCAAIDQRGSALVYENKTWTKMPAEAGMYALSCASSTFCVAVGFRGDATVFNGTSWGTPEQVDVQSDGADSLLSVSCPTVDYCAAMDESGNWVTYNGTQWSSPALMAPEGNGDTLGLQSLSCTSSTFCVAVGNPDDYVYRGESWVKDDAADNNLIESVSCASPTFCAAVDTGGSTLSFDGTSWSTPVEVDAQSPLSSVSCVSSTFCVAAGGEIATVFNGKTWSAPHNVDRSARNLRTVSCAAETFCVAGDIDGKVWTAT